MQVLHGTHRVLRQQILKLRKVSKDVLCVILESFFKCCNVCSFYFIVNNVHVSCRHAWLWESCCALEPSCTRAIFFLLIANCCTHSCKALNEINKIHELDILLRRVPKTSQSIAFYSPPFCLHACSSVHQRRL